jgi:hypothetical protein
VPTPHPFHSRISPASSLPSTKLRYLDKSRQFCYRSTSASFRTPTSVPPPPAALRLPGHNYTGKRWYGKYDPPIGRDAEAPMQYSELEPPMRYRLCLTLYYGPRTDTNSFGFCFF